MATEPQLHWYGHDAFQISNGQITVYLDPWKLPAGAEPADFVCITHEHFDHCSVEDVEKVAATTTAVIAPRVCANQPLPGKRTVLQPGERLEMKGVIIEAVPAYNIGKRFHPPADRRVGYILAIDGWRIYHAGDTDLIPEMDHIHCDIALLPVSGTYVMTADEAAQAAVRIKPKIAIPMHYGTIIGSVDDAKKFKSLVPAGIEVRVLPPVTSAA
ncbi:MAG: MBL fold metallo-hydrolase [Candidatus Kerfeldbacteria bacterium]|nr:MBL fold metallo-hydrolase [Candidatus Kerfeldbacteria bacterium]